jgi:hypothetical protein
MVDKITEEQYQELMDSYGERIPSEIVKTFDKLTGIVVKPYTSYQFFDAAGNYLGDDNWDSIAEILENAEIEVVEDGK